MKLTHLIAAAAAVAGLAASGLCASAGPVSLDAAALKGQAEAALRWCSDPRRPTAASTAFMAADSAAVASAAVATMALRPLRSSGRRYSGRSGYSGRGHSGHSSYSGRSYSGRSYSGHSGYSGRGYSSRYGYSGRYGHYGRYGYGYGRRGYWRDGRWYGYAGEAAAAYGESCYSTCRSAGYDVDYCTYHSGEFCCSHDDGAAKAAPRRFPVFQAALM